MSFSRFSCSSSPSSFFRPLFTSPFCPFSPDLHSFMLSSGPYTYLPTPYHFLLSLLPVLHPLFLSSTLLPLCLPLICIIFIRLFFVCIF
jgi:hypothetical protein